MLEDDMHLDVSTSPVTNEWDTPYNWGLAPPSEPLREKLKAHAVPPSLDHHRLFEDIPLSNESFAIPSPGDSQVSAFPWLHNESDISPSPQMEILLQQGFNDEDFCTASPSSPSGHGQDSNDGPEEICLPELFSAGLSLFPLDTEPSAIHHFKTYMTSTLSVKNAQWNIFSHFLASSKANTYSPVRSGIIAWAAAHRGLEGQKASNEYLVHYAQASSEMDALTTSLVVKNDWRQEQVDTVLATAYFLTHCDLVTGNMSGLVSRLDSIRELIRERRDLMSSGLTGISARLLLWLAYLDLRRSVFLPQGDHAADTIIGIIGNQGSLHRLYLRSRLYLKEAFGERYPSLELRDDMIQDPVNMKFAEGMSVFGRILQHARDGHENVPETRDALEKLHSEMVELERECDLALQGFDSGGSISITRTSYHWLNLKATTQCGLILLSRMRNPSCRTDDEAQSAAYKILKITIQLRKANKLHNPHSVFSVLPIFLAGIETVDEVHQDWIMRFLEDARGWGLHVQRAAQVLQRAVEKQKQTGCRLGFKDIADLASEQLVL
ncbi:unnamed protein product [Clonostachys byssicola]|uniref:Uncharacterized protein n=1 Tax=Clonostachys byssicola TaxID=160290 RepID=A0A9N9UJF1_9HYPO|nr:unnamed protein product [Clonostachys byssicola]